MWDCSVTTGTRILDERNRPDLQVINEKEEKIDVVEMACPTWRNRAETDERRTRKYTTVKEELKERNPGYEESERVFMFMESVTTDCITTPLFSFFVFLFIYRFRFIDKYY